MPALYLFNRRTLLAGDDLQLPSLAWGSVSTVQLFILVPYLLYYDIELLLTSPEKDDLNYHAYYDDNDWSSSESGRIIDNEEDLESITIRRRSLLLYSSNNNNDDDYFTTTMERYLPTMQTAECSKSTSQYTNYTFPILLFIYLIGITTYSAISLYYERRIFHTSSLGTPTINIHLRKPLKKLIEFKMIWLGGYNALLLLFGLCIGGVYIGGYNECFPTVWWIVWFVLFITQGVQFFINFTTLISLWRVNPASSLNATSTTAIVDDEQQLQNNNSDFYTRHVDSLHRHDNVSVAEELWQNRCEGCCRVLAVSTCFMFGGKGIVSHAAEGGGEKFYGDIARALADYFADFGDGSGQSTGLDVVPSDVGLGFVMLRHIQAQRKMLARRDALQQTNIGGGYGSSSSRSGSQTNLSAMDNSSPNRTTLLFRRRSPSQHEGSEVTTPQLNIESQTNEEEAYRSFSRTVLSPSNPDDYALIEEGAHFARHQLAIYTWILYYYQFPVSGTFRLIGRSLKAKMKCSNTSIGSETNNVRGSTTYEPCSIDVEPGNAAVRNSTVVEMNEETIVGDNFLHIHEATMLAHAGLEKADVAYANFEAGFYETPYCIIIDRKWKSIVLSIRGSLTLEDCVVDVLLDPSPLDALGEKYGFAGAGQHCHGGVAECTNWLHDDLMRHKILHTLLLVENAEYQDYTLRIVGHSLGAGIGVILSYMLRNTFPTLRCICYSPPGGLLSWELAKDCSEFVNSFVLDSDIVPRLSINNMERLRDEVLHLIARVKLSKYEIAQRIFWHGVCGDVELGDLDFLIQQNEDMLYAHDAVPESDFLTQLQRFEAMQQERRSSRGLARSINLYPPGKLTHIVKTGQSKQCMHGFFGCITCGASNAGAVYTPIQKENDDFNEIEISPTLWTDHFPNRVCAEIEKIANNFGIDTTLG